uniref:Uncharacterized protein n=1 Tax=Anguilla anguilla TaxID=7936 RepID=A0A0E9RUN2_ANGAN
MCIKPDSNCCLWNMTKRLYDFTLTLLFVHFFERAYSGYY